MPNKSDVLRVSNRRTSSLRSHRSSLKLHRLELQKTVNKRQFKRRNIKSKCTDVKFVRDLPTSRTCNYFRTKDQYLFRSLRCNPAIDHDFKENSKLLNNARKTYHSVLEMKQADSECFDLGLEFRYRDALLKIISTCRDHPNSWQYLEAVKKLYVSNLKIRAHYVSKFKESCIQNPIPVENDCDSGINSYGRNNQQKTRPTLRSNKFIFDEESTGESKSETEESSARASVTVSDIRIPLLWKGKDHFKMMTNKTMENIPSETSANSWSVFMLVQCGSQIQDSLLVSGIDASSTDISFEDPIVIKDLSPDFKLQFALYGHCSKKGFKEICCIPKYLSSPAIKPKLDTMTTSLFCTPTKYSSQKSKSSWLGKKYQEAKSDVHEALFKEDFWEKLHRKLRFENILSEKFMESSKETSVLEKRQRTRRSHLDRICLVDLQNIYMPQSLNLPFKNSYSSADLAPAITIPMVKELRPSEFELLATCHLTRQHLLDSVQVHDLDLCNSTTSFNEKKFQNTKHVLPILSHFSCKLVADPICFSEIQASGYVYLQTILDEKMYESISLSSTTSDTSICMNREPATSSKHQWSMVLAQLIGPQLIAWSELDIINIKRQEINPSKTKNDSISSPSGKRKEQSCNYLEPHFNFPITHETTYDVLQNDPSTYIITLYTDDLICPFKLMSESDCIYWDAKLRQHIDNLDTWKNAI